MNLNKVMSDAQDAYWYCQAILESSESAFPSRTLNDRIEALYGVRRAFSKIVDETQEQAAADLNADAWNDPRSEAAMKRIARRVLRYIAKLEAEHKFDARRGMSLAAIAEEEARWNRKA